MRTALAVATAPLALTLLIGAGFSSDGEAQPEAGINSAALPSLARQLLPQLADDMASQCPDLPVLWVLAETQAESGWNPRAYSTAGAAGLLQMMPATWRQAGGKGAAWPPSTGPASTHPVWNPRVHLQVALGWMCGNLRLVQAHLRAARKPIEALDALAVCHIAGCSRVTASATGIPRPGEAGCAARCVHEIAAYLAAIHHWVHAFAAPVAAGTTSGSAPAPTGAGRPAAW